MRGGGNMVLQPKCFVPVRKGARELEYRLSANFCK
jgi:hypothetical protein